MAVGYRAERLKNHTNLEHCGELALVSFLFYKALKKSKVICIYTVSMVTYCVLSTVLGTGCL